MPRRLAVALIISVPLVAGVGSKVLFGLQRGWSFDGPFGLPLGSVQFGALVAGLVFVEAVRRVSGQGLGLWDAWAVPLCLASLLGRLGCLFAGCCYGVPTDGLGVCFVAGTPAHTSQIAQGLISVNAHWSLALVPIQLYLAVWSGLAAIALLLIARLPGRVPGSLFALFLVIHGGGRLVLEFWRGDEEPLLWNLHLEHLEFLALAIGGVALYRTLD